MSIFADRQIRGHIAESGQNLPDQITRLEGTIKDLQGRIDRVIDAYESGLVEKSEFESRIVSLRERQDRERAALTSLRRDICDGDDAADAEAALVSVGQQVSGQLADASDDLKRDLCKLLIKRIEIGKDDIRLVYKVPPNPFVRSPENQGISQHWLLPTLTSPAVLVAFIEKRRFRLLSSSTLK